MIDWSGEIPIFFIEKKSTEKLEYRDKKDSNTGNLNTVVGKSFILCI